MLLKQACCTALPRRTWLGRKLSAVSTSSAARALAPSAMWQSARQRASAARTAGARAKPAAAAA